MIGTVSPGVVDYLGTRLPIITGMLSRTAHHSNYLNVSIRLLDGLCMPTGRLHGRPSENSGKLATVASTSRSTSLTY